MNTKATIATLCHDLGKALRLKWIYGEDNASYQFVPAESHGAGVVNYFNIIHSSQVQIISHPELKYLRNLPQSAADHQLFGAQTALIVLSDNLVVPPEVLELAKTHSVCILSSPLPGEQVINELQSYLTRALAEKISTHGVFMEVLSLGVLLTGASGVGKSELALELLTRGHRLIADDAPLFARIAPDIIIGTSSPILQDFLEVRGLGILNVREMYGDSAVKPSKYLKLIVDLQTLKETSAASSDRMATPSETLEVLGLDIPLFTLPVAPGRNLAVLVEAAVRNHILRTNRDYYASEDIATRQRKAMEESGIT